MGTPFTPAQVLRYDPAPGVVSFRFRAHGETIDIDDDEELEELREDMEDYVQALTIARLRVFEIYRLRFIKQHGLTDVEFNDPVNQALFDIQYPGVRS